MHAAPLSRQAALLLQLPGKLLMTGGPSQPWMLCPGADVRPLSCMKAMRDALHHICDVPEIVEQEQVRIVCRKCMPSCVDACKGYMKFSLALTGSTMSSIVPMYLFSTLKDSGVAS